MKCPHCGLINPPETQRCDCGYDFESKTMEASYLPESGEKERQVSNRALALLGLFCVVLLIGFRLMGVDVLADLSFLAALVLLLYSGLRALADRARKKASESS